MPNNYLPAKDLELAQWEDNFVSVANANLAALGIVKGDIDPINTAKTLFETNLTTVESAKTALKNTTKTKDTNRKAMVNLTRTLVKKLQANPNISDALKAQLRINVKGGVPRPVAPLAPTDLVVNGFDTGTNTLKWNRNTNAPNTTFVIEAFYGTTSNWFQVDTTTKTRYDHKGQTPGTQVTYRVYARRVDQFSEPSNFAVVYGPGTTITLFPGSQQAA